MAVHEVLGGELAWVADIDPGASAILACRFPLVPNLGDIRAADWSAIKPVDVLTAGFPCQDVSCAGGRAGLREGNRTGVWAHVARVIDELRPPLVVLENVRGLLSAGADSDMEPCPWCLGDSGDESALRALGAVLGDLADLGFDAEWTVVSAAEAGAPHRRERVFILAWPAADARSDQPGRHGAVPRVGPAHPGDGPGARDRGAPAHAHGPVGGERRQPAPGETEGWRPRSDAGGRGGAPAADPDSGDCPAGMESPARRSEGWRAGTPVDRSGDVGDPPPDTDGGRWGSRECDLCPGQSDASRLAPADTERGGRDRRAPLQVREQAERAIAPGGSRGADIAWGAYEFAIHRWERITGRPAGRPTEPGRTGERLSPRFVEWMMGLPEGWVTDVPGLSRNAQLKALGNGVVPQQAAMALRLLLERSGLLPLVAADLTPAEGGEAA